jgi:hypothetical protein
VQLDPDLSALHMKGVVIVSVLGVLQLKRDRNVVFGVGSGPGDSHTLLCSRGSGGGCNLTLTQAHGKG